MKAQFSYLDNVIGARSGIGDCVLAKHRNGLSSVPFADMERFPLEAKGRCSTTYTYSETCPTKERYLSEFRIMIQE